LPVCLSLNTGESEQFIVVTDKFHVPFKSAAAANEAHKTRLATTRNPINNVNHFTIPPSISEFEMQIE